MSDALRSLRNFFYLGLHKNVIKEAKNVVKESKESTVSGDVLYYRSYVALGQEDVVLKGIPQNAPIELQLVRLLATYKTTADDNKEMVFEQLKDWGESINQSPTAQLIAAQIYFDAKNYRQALKYVHAGHESLEMLAMSVQIYLKIDRIDLAQQTVKSMSDIDDDDTLTGLASSWIYIVQGGEKVNEAFNFLQELVEKFGPSIPTLNSLAICQIQLRNYTNAFQYLKQARDLAISGKEKVSAETLINSVVCLQHLRKPELITRILSELKQTHPNHIWLKKYNEMETAFDKFDKLEVF